MDEVQILSRLSGFGASPFCEIINDAARLGTCPPGVGLASGAKVITSGFPKTQRIRKDLCSEMSQEWISAFLFLCHTIGIYIYINNYVCMLSSIMFHPGWKNKRFADMTTRFSTTKSRGLANSGWIIGSCRNCLMSSWRLVLECPRIPLGAPCGQ